MDGNQRPMTEGEYRVGTSFNPSGNPVVDAIKNKAADMIDAMREEVPDANHPGYEASIVAAHKFEEAAMWAVKAVTKQPR